MARQRYDIGSKWLLQNEGKGVLLVGGLSNIRRTEAMPGEIVQNQRYPDGLLRAFLDDDSKPHHVLIEIATYPEKRALKQAIDDLTLAYSALKHLPDLLMLVLRPKGKFRIEGNHDVHSELGTASLGVKWKVVELWTLSAEQFLAEADVGVMPWVPLMQMDTAPERVLGRCIRRIKREGKANQQGDMLAISEVMTSLRFPNSELLAVFSGERKMILDTPVTRKWKAWGAHELIVDTLQERFGKLPEDVDALIRTIVDEKKLKRLNRTANKCADLDAFRKALTA